MEIKDYNKIQINYNIKRGSDDSVLERSTLVNIRTETAEEALMLYSSLKEKLNGELSPYENNKQAEINTKTEGGKICPNCGRVLVRRNAKNGDQFMGCSGYPNCRYTSKL